jgi:hypothetical protein
VMNPTESGPSEGQAFEVGAQVGMGRASREESGR